MEDTSRQPRVRINETNSKRIDFKRKVYRRIKARNKRPRSRGCRSQVVIVIPFYSDDSSSNPAQDYNYSVNSFWKEPE